jgi:hypothetical protein
VNVKRLSLSTKIYLGIVLFLLVYAVIASLRAHLQSLSSAGLPFAFDSLLAADFWQPLALTLGNTAITAGLGYAGLFLSSRIGFAAMWDESVTNRERFLRPALVGVGIGAFLCIFDLIAGRFVAFDRLYTSQFPYSILFSLNDGFTYELIYRLFFITFVIWLMSQITLRNQSSNRSFWIAASISAIIYVSTSVFPVTSVYEIAGRELPGVYVLEIVLFSGLVSILAAYYLRRAGFLAAAGVHIWANMVWLVIWEGLIVT